MRVSYGPPGAKGVTQLMAVDGADFDETKLEKAVKAGTVIAVGLAILGALGGGKTMRNAGLGGAAALVAVRWFATKTAVVPVTTPAP